MVVPAVDRELLINPMGFFFIYYSSAAIYVILVKSNLKLNNKEAGAGYGQQQGCADHCADRDSCFRMERGC
jgi:hypothetical protein